MKTYYQILGVSETADQPEIKRVFRKLAKENHPDINPGDAVAEARFKDINEAYGILGDPDKRAKYDADRKMSSDGRQQQASPKSKKAGTSASPFDYASMNYRDIFDNIIPEVDKKKTDKKEQKNPDPINVDSIFSKFMGFKP